ncbi:MAG: sugar phosphate isomerase/epimerase family protein [Chloroflexota bacterium]
MFKNLSPGAIGIRGYSLAQSIELAQQSGFGGIDFNIREAATLADEHGLPWVKRLFAEAGVRPGQWGLPVAWTKDDQWQADLAELPKLAALGRELGCTRTATWVTPSYDNMNFDAAWRWHVARFRPIAQVLDDYGCCLGLEFIGPKTSRDRRAYPFVYTLGGMMAMASEIGTGNVGLLLDAWHLYTSGGANDDLDSIAAKDVVTVHVNDAPAGVAVNDQIDNIRRLPMETGVIDLPGFMRKLALMGYDGPITPEPFSQRANELAAQNPLAAAQLVAEYMDKLWRAAGLQ